MNNYEKFNDEYFVVEKKDMVEVIDILFGNHYLPEDKSNDDHRLAEVMDMYPSSVEGMKDMWMINFKTTNAKYNLIVGEINKIGKLELRLDPKGHRELFVVIDK